MTAPSRIEKLLLEAARIFNSTIEYEELIDAVLKLVMTAVNSEAALVFRVDHQRTDVKVRLRTRRDQSMIVFRHELGIEVGDWATRFQEGTILNSPTESQQDEHPMARVAASEIRSLLIIPLIGKGQMLGVVKAINKIEGPFTESDLDIMAGLNNQIAVAIDNSHLYREIRKEALEKDLLYEIGKKLAGTLDLNEVLKAIMESLRQVVAYDTGAIFLVDSGQQDLKSLYSVGYNEEEQEQLRLKYGQGLSGTAARTGMPVIVPDVRLDDRYVNAHSQTRSEVVVPIMLDNRVLGVLNLESEQVNAFSRSATRLISAFATQAAIALERARLYESILDARKLDQQLSIAREIQQTFLPEKSPNVPGYQIVGTNISSGQVGGDYYDFIKIVDGHTGIAIGDVSGKGMPAALIMASFRASLIAEIRNNYSIRTICDKVNSLLYESIEAGNYVTAVYGVLDTRNHIFTFSNCGHNLPFLMRANGEVEYLREGGPILGVTASAEFEERAIFLNLGDCVILYTDGVTEVFDAAGVEYGLDRLVALVRAHRTESADALLKIIQETVMAHAADGHVFDDLTMIVIKRT